MLKGYIKTHFSGLYSLGRSVRDASKNSKKLKETEKLYSIAHEGVASVNSPLAIIFVNDGPKRLNLVLCDFSTKKVADFADFLSTGIKFARNNNYALRIISRNNLADPKAYIDFLKANNLEGPETYSFYTDSARRVSGKAHRLEITKNDIFFTEDELDKLKDWIKNAK